MAMAYHKRIDNYLSLCDYAQMRNDILTWYKALFNLYKEIYPKMKNLKDCNEKEKAEQLLKDCTDKLKDYKPTKDFCTDKFIELELFLRDILEKRDMLTPKKDPSGL